MSGNEIEKDDLDDLTVIKYIGPERQQWLRDVLKVHSYKDLSELSVEEIKRRLQDDGKREADSRIEVWIAEATKLAEQAKKEKKARAVDAVLKRSKTRRTKPSAKKKEGKKEEGWKSVGIFVVNIRERISKGRKEYLTEVSIHENGEQADFAEWSGIEKDESFNWMLQHAGLKPIPSEPEPVEKQPQEEPPEAELKGNAEVAISEIQFFQPPKAKKPLVTVGAGETLGLNLDSGEPFSVAVHFSLGGEAAESIAKRQATYRLRVVANELESKYSAHLGDSDPAELAEGTLDYTVTSPGATLDAGKYQLWAMVTVQSPNTVPNFLEVPLVTVA